MNQQKPWYPVGSLIPYQQGQGNPQPIPQQAMQPQQAMPQQAMKAQQQQMNPDAMQAQAQQQAAFQQNQNATQQPPVNPHQAFIQEAVKQGCSPDMVMGFLRNKLNM